MSRLEGQNLEGRVVHVTGASSGIGEACVERLAAEGAIVVGSDIADPPDGFAGAAFLECDVRDDARQKEVVEQIVADHGRLDVLVTAAGIASGGPVHSLELDEWQRCQDINLTGTMLSTKYALAPMLEQQSGSIITVASVEGIEGCEGGSSYNAAKGGVILLTKNLANDYGVAGVRANCICPGFIQTPMFHSVVDQMPWADEIRKQHKLRRFGEASEIAGAAYFLASDDSSFVTGISLPVDGGYTAGHSYGLAEMWNS